MERMILMNPLMVLYTVMVSMGFATIENISYTYQYKLNLRLGRECLQLFQCMPFLPLSWDIIWVSKSIMGKNYALIGLLYASLLHGIYDFVIISPGVPVCSISWLCCLYYFWSRVARKSIRIHQENSPFKKDF